MQQITGKYEVKEIDGKNCAIVEDKSSAERVEFLKKLLEKNGYEVHISETPVKPGTEANNTEEPLFTIGVSDITFNTSLALFGRHLQTLDNKVLLPHYWFSGHQGKISYWEEKAADYIN